jgi:hypothetical protein
MASLLAFPINRFFDINSKTRQQLLDVKFFPQTNAKIDSKLLYQAKQEKSGIFSF